MKTMHNKLSFNINNGWYSYDFFAMLSISTIFLIGIVNSYNANIADMFPPTDSAKNAVDMFPRTDGSKDSMSSTQAMLRR